MTVYNKAKICDQVSAAMTAAGYRTVKGVGFTTTPGSDNFSLHFTLLPDGNGYPFKQRIVINDVVDTAPVNYTCDKVYSIVHDQLWAFSKHEVDILKSLKASVRPVCRWDIIPGITLAQMIHKNTQHLNNIKQSFIFTNNGETSYIQETNPLKIGTFNHLIRGGIPFNINQLSSYSDCTFINTDNQYHEFVDGAQQINTCFYDAMSDRLMISKPLFDCMVNGKWPTTKEISARVRLSLESIGFTYMNDRRDYIEKHFSCPYDVNAV